MNIREELDKTTTLNYYKIYNDIKEVLDELNTVITIYDTFRQFTEILTDPNLSAEQMIGAIARGIVTSCFLNKMCKLKTFGPYVQGILFAFGTGNQVSSIVEAAKDGDWDLVTMRSIQLASQIFSLFQSCFSGDTLVAAEDGEKRIDEIEVGDKVWSWDYETGEVALKPVKQVFVNETNELIHLTVNGEEIVTTPTHPFYVAEKGWFAASSLRAGDILVLVNGEYVVVEKVQHELLEGTIKVYNLEVEDSHTYFVGEAGILVHNSCGSGGGTNSEKYSPINPCDEISQEVAETFRSGTFTKTTLTEDTVMYRVSGGKAGKVGSYLSRTPQGGGLQSQLDMALNPSWGNTAENIAEVVVPKGTTIYEGVAAPQNIYDSLGNIIGVLSGGGNQVYIPKVEAGWFK